MIKLPYGISHFPSLIQQGYRYVDRTHFIPQLEALGESYLIFLRPRRFGKSLWLSTLAHYYGREHAGQFDALFGKLTVGKTPTPLANHYLVLHLDFSGIDTQDRDSTYQGFLRRVRKAVRVFANQYPEVISLSDFQIIEAATSPEGLIDTFLQVVAKQSTSIYLLIDEYDHFTNELISFDLDHFQAIVSRQGWVRKFYETVKTGTGHGTIDRIFMTGVSPVTLDSLTSGFNIGADLSQDPGLHGLMGFTEAEVMTLMPEVGMPPQQEAKVRQDMQRWYNGYRFSQEGDFDRLYNPDMVLFFAKEYQKRQGYPDKILDTNIASDYGKIRRTFRLGSAETARYDTLRRLLSEGQVITPLTQQFSFEKRFTQQDFLSLLYYLGLLTIQGDELGMAVLGIPNLVIEKLYFDYFQELLDAELAHAPEPLDVNQMVRELALHNRPQPLMKLVADTLAEVSNRDFLHLNETGVKLILMSYLHSAQFYTLRSEHEVERGYVDLLLLHKPPIDTPHQFVFELKYLKQKDAHLLDQAVAEGHAQLRRYFDAPEMQREPNLHAWLAVWLGAELTVLEEVDSK